jgi:3-deoxy-D-manno-octulosonic-acid transferase
MSFLYNVFIFFYRFMAFIGSAVNPKVKAWVEGRRGLLERIREAMEKDPGGRERKLVWFHCASLGEFEQGRPLMERFRKEFPNYRICLTFFSPSGYEVRKKWEGADYVFYLPADTRANAREFLDLVGPDLVFFIKYEYWFNFLREISSRKIPHYVASAIFRPDQHFFRWYGSWFRRQLRKIDGFFVQDPGSGQLLQHAGITQVVVTGDTRFDRVFAIAGEEKPLPLIDKFAGQWKVIVAGSTWKEDEALLMSLINGDNFKMKFIIAPHETDPARIESLTRQFNKPFVKYSKAEGKELEEARILVIDSVGLLAYLYRYARIAYVGGGFGVGIHNILEAAAFGVPVIFGPGYRHFREAVDLVSEGGAFAFETENEFQNLVETLFIDEELYRHSSEICREYVRANQGATGRIISFIHGKG